MRSIDLKLNTASKALQKFNSPEHREAKNEISCIVMTRNSASTLDTCLRSTKGLFRDVFVIDSASKDDTIEIARRHNTNIISFEWNGQYPKKKQWCLENLPLKTDWVFYLDSDEVITPELAQEIRAAFSKPLKKTGFFIHGRHQLLGKTLRFGLHNNKLALFNRHYFHYPVINDLHLPLGEVEGHYQPIATTKNRPKIGQMKSPLLHLSMQCTQSHRARHEIYADWEAGMIERDLFPRDPIAYRQIIKHHIRKSRLRPALLFCISYFLKLGIFDGKQGYVFAKEKASYALQILRRLSRSRKTA